MWRHLISLQRQHAGQGMAALQGRPGGKHVQASRHTGGRQTGQRPALRARTAANQMWGSTSCSTQRPLSVSATSQLGRCGSGRGHAHRNAE